METMVGNCFLRRRRNVGVGKCESAAVRASKLTPVGESKAMQKPCCVVSRLRVAKPRDWQGKENKRHVNSKARKRRRVNSMAMKQETRQKHSKARKRRRVNSMARKQETRQKHSKESKDTSKARQRNKRHVDVNDSFVATDEIFVPRLT